MVTLRMSAHVAFFRAAFLSLVIAAGFGAGVLMVSGVGHATPSVGALAPDFKGTDSNGKTQTLSDYRGSIVVLEWTNHDCPFVRKHYDSSNMQSLQKEATAQKVVWLSIVSSAPGQQGHVTAKEANDLTEKRKAFPSAVILDSEGKIGRLYDARTTPHMFVIDKEGKLAYMGGIDDIKSTKVADVAKANNYVRPAIAAVQAGKNPKTSSATPYGCSVKYSH